MLPKPPEIAPLNKVNVSPACNAGPILVTISVPKPKLMFVATIWSLFGKLPRLSFIQTMLLRDAVFVTVSVPIPPPMPPPGETVPLPFKLPRIFPEPWRVWLPPSCSVPSLRPETSRTAPAMILMLVVLSKEPSVDPLKVRASTPLLIVVEPV